MPKIYHKIWLVIKRPAFSVFLLFTVSILSAQNKVNIPPIPIEWPLHTYNSMNKLRDTLVKHINEYDKRAIAFNSRCGGSIPAENKTLIAACQQESDALDILSNDVDKERDNFLFWFHDNEKIYAAYTASKAFQEKEQEKFEKMNAEWKKEQKGLVQQRLQKPNPWSKGICDALQKNAPPLPYKKLDELESGDVILLSPDLKEDLTIDKITGKIINLADKMASGSTTSEASHTITYLKQENGKKLFLDNNPGQGPQIITEEALQLKYGDRNAQVAKLSNYGIAQPLNKAEADKLFKTAKEMEAKNIAAKAEKAGNLIDKTNYGIRKENIVCSEASWLLIKSTGRAMPVSKSWVAQKAGIDFSPSDFYENTQYFLVTPLNLNIQKKSD
jgi:hypothetical protein